LGRPGKNAPVRMETVWPGGGKQTVEGIKANQFVTIREGKGIISSDPIRFAGTATNR
jgi:enediyne biosynthesis protein E4